MGKWGNDMYRWIMYSAQNIPGAISEDVDRFESLESARDAFIAFCRDVMYDDCSARLYWHDSEAWESAEEFRGIGCPFDYPTYIIERGPRGGYNLSRA